MDKTIVLAVAGAGKTYNICERVNINKKNLILAFTNENIKNIKNEMNKQYGEIPKLTEIMTFDSFKYKYLICPYEPTILEFFKNESFKRRGITVADPPKQTIVINGKRVPNKSYYNKNQFKHYINKDNKYYCSNLSELLLQIKNGKDKLIDRIADNLNNFFDCILIDEFQDFRKHDYDLIIALSKRIDNMVLVGDYYQHSVSGKNNSGKPFKNGKNFITYKDFVELLKKQKFNVDTTSLSGSRRCPKNICDFVKEKLNIEIYANNTNKGEIIWVDEDNIEAILLDDNITKLVFENSKIYSFKSINWSYSKGDTMSDICVFLTPKFENIDDDSFDINQISSITRNKIYVAFTRTDGDLYLVKSSVFEKVKSKYVN